MRTGTIIALWLDDEAAQEQIAALMTQLPAGVTPTLPHDCHLTLAVLPDVDLIPLEVRDDLATRLETLVTELGPAWLAIESVAQFPDDDGDGRAAVVAHVNLAGVALLRARALAVCAEAGVEVGGFDEYRPHITLGTGPANLDLTGLPAPDAAWAADRLCLALGPGRTTWTLTGAAKARRTITGGTTMHKASPAAAELKAAPHFVKSINGRTVVGIFSVFGNRDAYDDIIYPGSFLKTIRERGSKVLHLWQHDGDEPPIARVEALREIGREELPPETRTQYPDATGGCEVTRTYLETPRGQEVFTNLTSSVPLQMSFMFEPVKWETMEDDAADWGYTRHIREVRLWETSDVNWGANAATLASKRRAALDLDLAAIDRALTGLKAGARHSAEDTRLINSIHRSVVDLGCTVCAGQVDAADAAAKAALYTQGLLALLDTAALADDFLAPLARRLGRPDAQIDPTTPPAAPPEAAPESRAADVSALTPDAPVMPAMVQYQYRARLLAARLQLARHTNGAH